MKYHSILEKQIARFLPQAYLEEEGMQIFLDTISKCYASFEKDKKITEHAFDISEREYQIVTSDLETQNEIRKQSILKLKQAIRALDPNNRGSFSENEEDVINMFSFLEAQIAKTKQLEQDLIKAKEVAEKAAYAKSEFLSVMSHEIRTPLNAIIGTIMLLQYQDLTTEQKELLDVMEISSENLLSLINDVLDFSKMEEGKIFFMERSINILHFLKNIKLANRVRAAEKGNIIKIIFDDDLPKFVVGDDIRLGQILNNIVSNAAKFTNNGTITITVGLNRIEQEDVFIDFSIEDNGIGIPLEKQSIIFERFTQASNNITREFGGSGLGLTIIKRLLELQNSAIHLESTPGKGSKFYFTLAFKQKEVTETEKIIPALHEQKPDMHGIRILLVEDVSFNVMVAEKMLKHWNAEVDIASNGVIAVEKIRNNTYDLILMDIQMPVMDGYTATSEIRKFNTTIPIIALTASTINLDIESQAKKSGMNGCITKPFNPSDLYSIIVENTNNSA